MDRARAGSASMKGFTLGLLFVSCGLTGCAPLSAPLASSTEIAAAESAPLDETAIKMRWNDPLAPFNIIGNIHYIGTSGIGAYLITTPEGHIVIDGSVPQSAPQILANIETLGFRRDDVRYLLATHAHYDHAGGLAAIQRATGAIFFASAADRPYYEAGAVDHGPSAGIRFPPIRVDRVIADGDTVSLGGTVLTAHFTPGHSPGCTSWSLAVSASDGTPHRAFLHCSATVAGQKLAPEAYPGIVDNFRATFEKVRAIEADVFLANHDIFFGLAEKRARRLAGDEAAFVDPGALQAFNTAMEKAFETQLAMEEDMAR